MLITTLLAMDNRKMTSHAEKGLFSIQFKLRFWIPKTMISTITVRQRITNKSQKTLTVLILSVYTYLISKAIVKNGKLIKKLPKSEKNSDNPTTL